MINNYKSDNISRYYYHLPCQVQYDKHSKLYLPEQNKQQYI